MKYLIFRSDRIGDFLITSPLIQSIKRNDKDHSIEVVCSSKNYNFINNLNLVNKIHILKKNNFISKFNLFLKLKANFYDVIIVSDKKNRSIILSIFMKSKIKIFNVSKKFIYNFLKFFYKNIFLDNDFLPYSIKEIQKKNLDCINFELIKEDFHFFKRNQFKNYLKNLKNFEIPDDFILIHYDEKWEVQAYAQSFYKAKNFVDLEIEYTSFIKFLFEISNKIHSNIIITTGIINTNFINRFINAAEKINSNVYKLEKNSKKIFCIINQNFESVSHLISVSKCFISCHGAFTHVASNYNIKQIDIINFDKKNHYKRITSSIKDYSVVFRKKFPNLSIDILNLL